MSVGFGEQDAHDRAAVVTASLQFAPERLVVHLSGELDLSSDGEIRELFDKVACHGAHVTVVDLSEVTFIDAHEVGLIIAAYRSAVERGRVLGVVGLQGVVAHVFGLFHLEALVLPAAEAYDHEGDVGGQR
jgi:anti-anti-sigma factor